MSHRKRMAALILIMSIVVVAIAATMCSALYMASLNRQEYWLEDNLRGRVILLRSFAENDLVERAQPSDVTAIDERIAWLTRNLERIENAREDFPHIFETDEFMCAYREDGVVVWVTRHRFEGSGEGFELEGDLRDEAMERALGGESGVMKGVDYRGERVLAAYKFLPEYGVGLVKKIDLHELSRPFINVTWLASLIGVVLAIMGAWLFHWVGEPMVAALEQSEARLRTFYESGMVGMGGLTPDGRWLFVNDGFCKFVGYGEEELLEKTWDDVAPVEGDDSARAFFRETVIGNGDNHHGEKRLVTKNGETIYAAISFFAQRGRRGGIESYYMFARDITNRTRAELRRKQLQRELNRKNKELSQLVYVASHDLRSPLVNVQGFSNELALSIEELRGMAASGDLGGEQSIERIKALLDREAPECLEFIRAGVMKMDLLLSGLLRLSRLGRTAIIWERLDIDDMVGGIVTSHQFQLREKNIVIELGDLSDCWGDRAQVNQVFSNLIENAMKYLDEERPGRISVGCLESNNGKVGYVVEDNGIGIDPGHQAKVFELFHRLDPNGTEGEGLGLTIVRTILDRLGGDIRVESEPGRGSRFIFSLPNQKPDMEGDSSDE